MSLRIVPPSSLPTATSNTHSSIKPSSLPRGAPSAPGVPDTLRSSQTTVTGGNGSGNGDGDVVVLSSSHPLEARLARWTQTQDSLKLETLRRTYGIAEPVRRGMELKIVREGSWRPAVLGGGVPSVHEDILTGRDAEITWEDVYTDAGRAVGDGVGGEDGVHGEMERLVGMGKW